MPYMDKHSAERLVNTYADMILRISFLYLKQAYDAEDICQDVFMKLLMGDFRFATPEHERSWIVRTTINACKDHLRTGFWKRAVDLGSVMEVEAPKKPDSEILDLVMSLPSNYRISIYLRYYEGYQVNEIAAMLGKSENTVSAYLSRGRKKLRALIEKSGGGPQFCLLKGGMRRVGK